MGATFAVGYVILHRLKIGRRIYAVGGNRDAARLSGIRVSRVLMFAFVFAGLCAGIASLTCTAKLSCGQPAGSVGFELDVIAAVVVGGTSLFGGRGRLAGTFLGALSDRRSRQRPDLDERAVLLAADRHRSRRRRRGRARPGHPRGAGEMSLAEATTTDRDPLEQNGISKHYAGVAALQRRLTDPGARQDSRPRRRERLP